MDGDEFYTAPKSAIIDSNNDPKKPNATVITLLILVVVAQLVTTLIVALEQNLSGVSTIAYLIFAIVVIPAGFMLMFQRIEQFQSMRARAILILSSSSVYWVMQIIYLLN